MPRAAASRSAVGTHIPARSAAHWLSSPVPTVEFFLYEIRCKDSLLVYKRVDAGDERLENIGGIEPRLPFHEHIGIHRVEWPARSLTHHRLLPPGDLGGPS